METRFDIETGIKEFSINLYPQQKMLNNAIFETIKYLNWTRYAIVYEGKNFVNILENIIVLSVMFIKNYRSIQAARPHENC